MEASGATVLIVDDDPTARRLIEVRLKALGCETATASDGQQALERIQSDPPSLVLLDLQMPRMSGLEVLQALHQAGIDIPVIVITAHGSVEAAVDAMKAGAYDFLPKPFDPKHLEIVVRKALERTTLVESNRLLRDTLAARTSEVLGESSAIRQAVEVARRAADTNTTVLLLGESGTGKEIFAQSIHRWSPRSERPLVVVNCVALSEHLLESELFGHEKGAFTGAHQTKRGKFELAQGSTVFLDEIGDMASSLQVKLLRVLQERTIERVGGTRPIRADVRIIAATNRDLDAAVKEGRFREDLFYRLNVVRILLPPLRQRREDIALLAHHFVAKYAAETKRPVQGIAQSALDALTAHDWPGNVRELANMIERAVVLCGRTQIQLEDLALPAMTPDGGAPVAARVEVEDFHGGVKAYKQALIRAALRKADGNQTQAAEALGLQRTYLVKLLRSLNIREDA